MAVQKQVKENSSKGVSEQQHQSCARLRHRGTCGRLFRLSSHKTSRSKRFLAKKTRQNRPIPHWIWAETSNTTRHNSKRRHWRGTRLGLQGVARERRSHPAAPRMPSAHHVPEKLDHYCRAAGCFYQEIIGRIFLFVDIFLHQQAGSVINM